MLEAVSLFFKFVTVKGKKGGRLRAGGGLSAVRNLPGMTHHMQDPHLVCIGVQDPDRVCMSLCLTDSCSGS